MDLQQFIDWFEKPVDLLEGYDHSGFAVLMITIPLAERLFHSRTKKKDGGLKKPFLNAFVVEFPNLTPEQAKQFWERYRHGLMHQGTVLPGRKFGGTLISSADMNAPNIINYDAATDTFLVKPKEFARKIIGLIVADYPTFATGNAFLPPLSQVTGIPSVWQLSTGEIGPSQGGTGADHSGATGCQASPRP